MLAHQYDGPQLHWADPSDGAGLLDTMDTVTTNINMEEDIMVRILILILITFIVEKLWLLHSEIKFSEETNNFS